MEKSHWEKKYFANCKYRFRVETPGVENSDPFGYTKDAARWCPAITHRRVLCDMHSCILVDHCGICSDREEITLFRVNGYKIKMCKSCRALRATREVGA